MHKQLIMRLVVKWQGQAKRQRWPLIPRNNLLSEGVRFGDLSQAEKAEFT
jgi:hypothetical protein